MALSCCIPASLYAIEIKSPALFLHQSDAVRRPNLKHKSRACARISRPYHPQLLSPTPTALPDSSSSSSVQKDEASAAEGEESSFSVLTALSSRYNDIMVVDTPKSRLLLLDSSHNIHSMLNKDNKWTGSYWDEFAALPAIVPKGPIAIFGLGGGTAAHLMLELWPALHLEGWEIDEILIDMAREHFNLSDLEKCTQAGGLLSVHIGDAFLASASVQGGFAGIIVDLFSGGKILPQLQEVSTWLEFDKKLMPHGRIMVNCGGAQCESSDGKENSNMLPSGSWVQNYTVKALCEAFPGKLSWKRMAEKDSENYLALTGSFPDLNAWSAALPSPLDVNVKDWKPCDPASEVTFPSKS